MVEVNLEIVKSPSVAIQFHHIARHAWFLFLSTSLSIARDFRVVGPKILCFLDEDMHSITLHSLVSKQWPRKTGGEMETREPLLSSSL